MDLQENPRRGGAPTIITSCSATDWKECIGAEDALPDRGGNSVKKQSSSGKNSNIISVEVEEMEFLGSFWRVSLGGKPLQGTNLTADMSVNAVRRMNVEPGSTIRIELPPDRLMVFDRQKEAGA